MMSGLYITIYSIYAVRFWGARTKATVHLVVTRTVVVEMVVERHDHSHDSKLDWICLCGAKGMMTPRLALE